MKGLFLIMFTILSTHVLAEETLRDRIRGRIKDRWVKKQESQPAPIIDTKVDSPITRGGDYTLSIVHDKLPRMYKIHVPAKYNPNSPTPLLVVLHGGGGNMEFQASDKLYKQISLAEELGHIVVFPNGFSKLQSGKFATWNAGKCCGEARDEKIDDVGFIKEVITHTEAQLNVDKSRIFATGMSNGGMMSYKLACEMSDVFKGVASVAGTDNTIECIPKNPISILHIHARNDDHVLFDGGSGKVFKDKSKVTDFTSVPATIAKWVKLNGCNETPKRTLDKLGAYCDLYSSCKNKVEVQLCVTESGGHSWPGGEKNWGSESPTKAISANEVMWDFFQNK